MPRWQQFDRIPGQIKNMSVIILYTYLLVDLWSLLICWFVAHSASLLSLPHYTSLTDSLSSRTHHGHSYNVASTRTFFFLRIFVAYIFLAGVSSRCQEELSIIQLRDIGHNWWILHLMPRTPPQKGTTPLKKKTETWTETSASSKKAPERGTGNFCADW